MQMLLDGASRVDRAIARLCEFEPPEGYILCFSGGKDSVALRELADMAGVKYEPHYHVTTIDPPPVIRFIHRNYPDTVFDRPGHGKSFAAMFAVNGFPLRRTRWCCAEFKERNFPGRILLWGLRDAEKRQSGPVRLTRICRGTGARTVNPLFDWTTTDVWDFIRSRKLPYCELYDQGWTRIGCVICPFTSAQVRARNRARWPRMFERVRIAFHKRWERLWTQTDMATRFPGPDELFEWWLSNESFPDVEQEGDLFA